MNYRHHYHAGNFADVFKHVLLVSLVQAMRRKEKPLCYLETHAGLGFYDLQQEPAQKTLEHVTGIGKLWPELAHAPSSMRDYFHIIQSANPESSLSCYPGSPYFVSQLLGADDRMVLAELHPEDVLQLKQLFAKDKRISIHHMNGYHALKAFLPPKLTRGLVLIDPPFEQTDEFEQILAHLKIAVRRFIAGVYAVWFPIKDKMAVQNFYNQLRRSNFGEITCCEIQLPQPSVGLQACGMVIIHPPWQWAEEIAQLLPWLCQTLSHPYVGQWCIKNV